MSERNGIEIDYCPTCRGVWLDRGELDKILERSAAPVAASRVNRRDDDARYDDPRYDRRRRDDDDDEGGIAGFLGNIFS